MLPPPGATVYVVHTAAATAALADAVAALPSVGDVASSTDEVHFTHDGFSGRIELRCVGDPVTGARGYWPRLALGGRRAGVSARRVGDVIRLVTLLPSAVATALEEVAEERWSVGPAVAPEGDCSVAAGSYSGRT
ncbi:MAG: hypothetical protein AAGE01_17265 [Pseudomonadota bacterium]